jgi:NAD(P)-dependent dehydrogenase (short-subunit alcohol dehydrogenase family)
VDLLDLTGRVAVVTGGGTGIGAATAVLLAVHGADVVIAARTIEDLERTAETIEARSGRRCVVIPTDVKDEQQVVAMIERSVAELGRLDILVNNAGVPEAKTLHRQTAQEFRSIFEINFFGTLNVTLPIYQHMRKCGYGRIIVSTSSAGLHGNHGMAAYASSKAALIGLARTIATEGIAHGVRCNALAPYGATQMTETYLTEDLRTRMHPRFVAPVAAWLASEACTANGEVFVAGAGRARRAAMVEADGVVGDLTPELLAAHDGALRSLAGEHEFRHANAAFEHFMASTGAHRIG